MALALGACSGGSEDAAETAAMPAVAPADLVLRGGKVATADPALGNAEAIAVNGYQITAVGGNDEISAVSAASSDPPLLRPTARPPSAAGSGNAWRILTIMIVERGR